VDCESADALEDSLAGAEVSAASEGELPHADKADTIIRADSVADKSFFPICFMMVDSLRNLLYTDCNGCTLKLS